MPSRRPHTKSRHGCLECKARKVKCNQDKPACARCTRNEQSCHYDMISGKLSSRKPSPGPGMDTIPLAKSPGVSLDSHLQLTSLKRSEKLAPEEAFKHRFLLHGILAIAALHKARHDPDTAPEITMLAIQHYTTAISLFRPVITDIHPGNAVAAFMLSGLLVCISWALPLAHPDSVGNIHMLTTDETLQHILDILQLLRGIREIVDSSWAWTRQLTPIFELAINDPDAVFPPEEEAILQALQERVRAETKTSAERDMYDDMLRQFRMFWPLEHRPYAHGLVHAWSTRISDCFMKAILEKKSEALLILAYHGLCCMS
ncbi:C6 finger domain-containing protein [Botrytis cinerea]